MRKEAEKRQFTAILKEQIVMDDMKKQIERKEDQMGQELVHFGPEDSKYKINYVKDSVKEKKKMLETELKKQMGEANELKRDIKKTDQIIDRTTLSEIEHEIQREKEISANKRDGEKRLYNAEWELQKIEAENRKKIEDILNGGVY